MSKPGWIKLHRSILDHWLFSDVRELSRQEAWIRMLLLVNYQPKKELIKGQLYTCDPGQSLFSLESWAREFNWSLQKVRTFFKTLEKDNMIITEGLQYTTRLTICNWDTYQLDATDGQQTANTPLTDGQQTANTPLTTTKEVKKEKKDKKDKKVRNNVENIFDYDSEPIQITILSFEEFWELYDKKVGDKERLRKKWEHVKEEDRLKIAEHIPAYRMTQPDKKYRKNPDTYLNNKSWNDEIIIPNGATKIGSANNGAQRDVNELAAILQKHINT